MFFSKTLLTATGALASVWLSSNQEKKVSKNQVIQHNVQKSVNAIMEPQEEAPLSLRLSGQLLYGVVRIYGRKARYLLDDCNEAIMKIKMVRLIYLLTVTVRDACANRLRHSARTRETSISLRTCRRKPRIP